MALPTFTVFDVETTGLDPRKGHRIIELAGVRVEGGTVLPDRVFSSFVNPERPIPLDAQQVSHIKDADVADAPGIMTVLPQFLEFAQGTVLVAHNASFDMGFLTVEKEFCWGFLDLPECLCTMRFSQSIWPDAFRHSLDQVAGRLQLPLPANRHRALPDVLLTAEALVRMLAQTKVSSLDELRRRAALQGVVATAR